MENCMRFYVMYSKDNKDVEFVNAENRLRMQSLTLKGYKNIGTGEHEDLKELNRGVCSNMRGMYEFQVRQNMLLKKELERALMLLKEVHRISDLTPGIQPLSHSVTAPLAQGSRGRDVFDKLGVGFIEEHINCRHCTPTQLVKEFERQLKDFWEEVN
ncbi:MAG: hypothetical protein J6D26_04150 [Clostridia bacterium]|nr:hypothetical protein [Clostridia bacterium]